MWKPFAAALPALVLLLPVPHAWSQEAPYFVAYTHHLEEPGNLEVEVHSVTGKPQAGNRFLGNTVELEYGTTAWWTTELYLDSQSTANESTVLTGFRLENRIRPMFRQHWINPVIYFEFEDIHESDKGLREVVGHDGRDDFLEPNSDTHAEREREVELRLILSSDFKGWNLSENLIAEKNLSNEPWEFGYAIAASRPLRLKASPKRCNFCLQKFAAGVELYGGLGDRYSFGTRNTSHYLGPTVNWSAPGGITVSFSPNFGLNDYSIPRLYRFGFSYEIDQVFGRLGFLHGGGKK